MYSQNANTANVATVANVSPGSQQGASVVCQLHFAKKTKNKTGKRKMLSGVKWQQSHSVFPVNFAASFQVQLCRQT